MASYDSTYQLLGADDGRVIVGRDFCTPMGMYNVTRLHCAHVRGSEPRPQFSIADIATPAQVASARLQNGRMPRRETIWSCTPETSAFPVNGFRCSRRRGRTGPSLRGTANSFLLRGRRKRRPSKRQYRAIGARLAPFAVGACASSRRSNAGCSRARGPGLSHQPKRRHDPAWRTITSHRNTPCLGDRHPRASLQKLDQSREHRERRAPIATTDARKVLLAASPSAWSPTQRRHHRAPAKAEKPVPHPR